MCWKGYQFCKEGGGGDRNMSLVMFVTTILTKTPGKREEFDKTVSREAQGYRATALH